MRVRNWKKEVWTIPNLLSLFRLVLIPVYVRIYLNAETQAEFALAAGILAASCLTDMVDGKIARKYHMISTLGKILDPIADKLTQFTLIVCLALRHPVLWLLIALFVAKELFQLIAGLVNLRRRRMLSGALFSGKLCTTVLFISLILLVLLPGLSGSAVNIIASVCAVFMILTFADYVKAYLGSTPMLEDMDQDDTH